METLLKVAYGFLGGPIQAIQSVSNYFGSFDKRWKGWGEFFENQENRIKRATKVAGKKFYGEPMLLEYMNKLVGKAKDAWH